MVAQISELDDRDQAEALAGFTVHVSRSLFPPAKKDEFYWIDLEGCAVYSSNDSAQVGGHEVYVGDVTEVLDNGAHAILRVQRRSAIEPHENLLDSKGRAIEMLIPFVATHVQQVDIPARKIVTDWPLDF